MSRNKHLLLTIIFQWIISSFFIGMPSFAKESRYIDIGSGRELFVDYYLIDRLDGAHLILHHPHDEGPVLKFEQPWEGPFCGYCTVIKDQDKYHFYYRGLPQAGRDGSSREVTCYAESLDGIHITKPKPISGYSLRDAEELIGNYIEHPASWRHGTDVGPLSGRPIRLHFVMKDANLYSLQFRL